MKNRVKLVDDKWFHYIMDICCNAVIFKSFSKVFGECVTWVEKHTSVASSECVSPERPPGWADISQAAASTASSTSRAFQCAAGQVVHPVVFSDPLFLRGH
jgi:hypothetical protein